MLPIFLECIVLYISSFVCTILYVRPTERNHRVWDMDFWQPSSLNTKTANILDNFEFNNPIQLLQNAAGCKLIYDAEVWPQQDAMGQTNLQHYLIVFTTHAESMDHDHISHHSTLLCHFPSALFLLHCHLGIICAAQWQLCWSTKLSTWKQAHYSSEHLPSVLANP